MTYNNGRGIWQWLLIFTLLGIYTLPAQAVIPDNIDHQVISPTAAAVPSTARLTSASLYII